ncbi:MAG: hypothetical protein ACI9TH_000778 [Kiritimatiellia bacterium]|jgi:hypothetical protein
MKNLIIAALSIAVVGLGAYVVTLKKDLNNEPLPQGIDLAVKPAAPTPVAAVKPAPIPERPASLASETAFPDLDSFETYPSDAAVEQLKKANHLIVALHEQNQVLEEETTPSLAKGLKQIVESPELKGMMRAGMSQDVKRRNGALFRRLGLNEEQESMMTNLLVDQGVDGIATGIQWMAGNIEESAARTVAAREKMHAAIMGKLGPEVLSEYQYWEDSKNERESVQKFNRRLGEAGVDEDLQDKLTGLLYDARSKFPELDNMSKPENYNPREMTPERRGEILVQVEELHDTYLQEAAALLSQEQLDSLVESLGGQRQELDGFMKFTHNMISRQDERKATTE